MQPITLHFDINGGFLGQMSPSNILESAKYHIIFADEDFVDFNLYEYTYGGNYLPDLKDFETYSLDVVNKIVSTKITNIPLEMTKKSKINDVDLSLKSFLCKRLTVAVSGSLCICMTKARKERISIHTLRKSFFYPFCFCICRIFE